MFSGGRQVQSRYGTGILGRRLSYYLQSLLTCRKDSANTVKFVLSGHFKAARKRMSITSKHSNSSRNLGQSWKNAITKQKMLTTQLCITPVVYEQQKDIEFVVLKYLGLNLSIVTQKSGIEPFLYLLYSINQKE